MNTNDFNYGQTVSAELEHVLSKILDTGIGKRELIIYPDLPDIVSLC